MTTGFGWHVVVAIACLLVMIQVGYRASGVKLTRTSLVAVARACVQLTLAALLITSVVRYLWASVLAVAVMFIVAVLTTTKRSGATALMPPPARVDGSARAWPRAAAPAAGSAR